MVTEGGQASSRNLSRLSPDEAKAKESLPRHLTTFEP